MFFVPFVMKIICVNLRNLSAVLSFVALAKKEAPALHSTQCGGGLAKAESVVPFVSFTFVSWWLTNFTV